MTPQTGTPARSHATRQPHSHIEQPARALAAAKRQRLSRSYAAGTQLASFARTVSATPIYTAIATGLACALLCGLGSGCVRRTVPLPPPSIDDTIALEQGQVQVLGQALSGALVGVYNEDLGTGVLVSVSEEECEQSCPFAATVSGEPGHSLRIWQFFDTESTLFHTVPEP